MQWSTGADAAVFGAAELSAQCGGGTGVFAPGEAGLGGYTRPAWRGTDQLPYRCFGERSRRRVFTGRADSSLDRTHADMRVHAHGAEVVGGSVGGMSWEGGIGAGGSAGGGAAAGSVRVEQDRSGFSW